MFEDQTYSIHGFTHYQRLTKVVGVFFIFLFFACYIAWWIFRGLSWGGTGDFFIDLFFQVYLTVWVTTYGVAGFFLLKLDRLAYPFFFFTFFATVVMTVGVIFYFIYFGLSNVMNGGWMIMVGWAGFLVVQFIIAKLISRLVIYGVIT